MKKMFVTLAMCLSFSATLLAQEVITNAEVIQMTQAGLGKEIILSKISTENTSFDLSVDALKALKEGGVDDEIIQIMLYKTTMTDPNSPNFFPSSIKIEAGKVIINGAIELKKGDKLKVLLPYSKGRDFISIEEKKGLFNLKNLAKVADIVGSGAVAVGLGSNDLGTVLGAYEVTKKTQAVSWGIDALEKINELPISKNAKKIAGKEFEITDFNTDDNQNVKLIGKINKKNYIIDLHNALTLKEVKLLN